MKFPILTYHSILPSQEILKKSKKDRIYCLEDAVFKEQLAYLNDNSFSTLTFRELKEISLNDRQPPKKPIILTFDDGYENNYRIAFPLLQEVSMKATFFVITSLIGKPGYLKWEQIDDMFRHGMEIQSHTHTHVPLDSLSNAALRKELTVSKQILESNLKSQIFVLSVPHGWKPKTMRSAAMESGYEFICTSKWGTNQTNHDIFLKRFPIKNKDKMSKFVAFAEAKRGPLLIYMIKKLPVRIARKCLSKRYYNSMRDFMLRDDKCK